MAVTKLRNFFRLFLQFDMLEWLSKRSCFKKILSVQVLINQLKDVAPTIQNSISQLTEEVNSISSNLPPVMKLRSNSPIQAQSSGRTLVI